MAEGQSLISSLLGHGEATVVEDVGEGMQVSVGVWLEQGEYCQIFFSVVKAPFSWYLGDLYLEVFVLLMGNHSGH